MMAADRWPVPINTRRQSVLLKAELP